MKIFIIVEHDMFGTTTRIFEARVFQLSNGIEKTKSAYSSTAYRLRNQ
jgi:hypothetical protein